MKVVALLAVVIGVVYSQVDIPVGALTAVRNAGVQAISDRVALDNQRLVTAIEEFKPINASCNTKIQAAIPNCRTCVESKCKSRAQSVCKPEQWQVALGKTIGFFKDGIPNFFTGTIPDVFVNKIGGGLLDVTKDVLGGLSGFGSDAIGGIVDVGKGIGDGIIDLGKNIGTGIVDVGKTIGDGIGKAIDGIKDVGDKLKDIGSGIGKIFGGIFGKRELMSHESYIRSRRQGEPGCSDFENNAEQACKFYLQPSYCSACGFSAETECTGYKAAIAEINAANAQRKWMVSIKKQNYDITRMTFNPALMSPTGGFKNVVVYINLFGKDLQFTMQEPINPYIPNAAGPIIAKQALAEYMKA